MDSINKTKPKLTQYYDGITKLIEPHELGQGLLDPVGVTVHYTADRNLKRVHRVLKANNLGYHLIICRDGTCTQIAPFDQKVWHAGKAAWRGNSPNHSHISVALLSWGKLEARGSGYYAWNDEKIKDKDAVHRMGNTGPGQHWWDKATDLQFDALMEFCIWACERGILPSDVCGHDEAALPKGRKSDPGGVLPVTMERFREMLDQELIKKMANA